MKNTTKLKILLQKYTIALDMEEDDQFILMLTDKSNNHSEKFTAESYSRVIGKAYSHLLKELKNRNI